MVKKVFTYIVHIFYVKYEAQFIYILCKYLRYCQYYQRYPRLFQTLIFISTLCVYHFYKYNLQFSADTFENLKFASLFKIFNVVQCLEIRLLNFSFGRYQLCVRPFYGQSPELQRWLRYITALLVIAYVSFECSKVKLLISLAGNRLWFLTLLICKSGLTRDKLLVLFLLLVKLYVVVYSMANQFVQNSALPSNTQLNDLYSPNKKFK